MSEHTNLRTSKDFFKHKAGKEVEFAHTASTEEHIRLADIG